MKFIKISLPSLLFFTYLATSSALAKGDGFEQVLIKTQQVSDNLYMLTGEGGNIGLSVGADGVFMIDDQFTPLSTKIQAAIAKITSQPIKFVINMHCHLTIQAAMKTWARRTLLLWRTTRCASA
ncbi:hypothetical protein [Abyssogena phaseoliformis symbiont]|uniref:hypothetical protein n=1 Tax=Abyssogena phaseoliformis symbiont TaxID=596095 RepID=UPI00191655FB|nr:hypothetical protein [Abyssogena phaseoliformis symbiont]